MTCLKTVLGLRVGQQSGPLDVKPNLPSPEAALSTRHTTTCQEVAYELRGPHYTAAGSIVIK